MSQFTNEHLLGHFGSVFLKRNTHNSTSYDLYWGINLIIHLSFTVILLYHRLLAPVLVQCFVYMMIHFQLYSTSSNNSSSLDKTSRTSILLIYQIMDIEWTNMLFLVWTWKWRRLNGKKSRNSGPSNLATWRSLSSGMHQFCLAQIKFTCSVDIHFIYYL